VLSRKAHDLEERVQIEDERQWRERDSDHRGSRAWDDDDN